MNISAIILSAGESIRMGTPKAFLSDINSEVFITNQIRTYKAFGCEEIIVVVNEKVLKFALQNNIDCFKHVVIVTNEKLELGRFYSLKLGIKALTGAEYCFIHNVDNPLNDKVILEKIYKSRNEADFIVPKKNSQNGHPILLNQAIIKSIRSESLDNLKINEFLTKFKKKAVDVPNDLIHYNINTQKDYEDYFRKYKI
ncbi:NTP transferase domain-containing protein [Bacteroidota bacterium]